MQSDYSSLGGNKLSPYDDIIKQGADKLGWDWRLLAAVVYQESKFNPTDESWAGAKGLMQLMPETAKRFGATDLKDPKQSLKAGVNYLMYLEKYWTKRIPDQAGAAKVRFGVIQCRPLAYSGCPEAVPEVWQGRSKWYGRGIFLLKKSDPKFYRDPLVTAGYCKCEEPVNYVSRSSGEL